MKIKTINIIVFAILFLSAFSANAQKDYHKDQSAIEAAAISQLDGMMHNEKVLKKLNKEDIHGDYTYKVTVKEKSKIASMLFLNKSESASIKGQNYFNYLVSNYKFDFKIPKGNYYTFEYTFKAP